MDNYSYYSPAQVQTRPATGLFPKVATLFVFSCVATAVGAYLGRNLPFVNPLLFLAVIIGSLFLVQAVRKVEPLNVIVLYGFNLLIGVMIAPIINYYASSQGGPALITEAMVVSGAVFSGAAAFGWATSTNLQPLRRYLVAGLFGLIAIGLLSFFFLHSAGIALAYNFAIVAIVVAFTAIDFQRIRRRYPADEYIMATVAIYLDFLNIFLAVLSILGGGRRR
jgi:modulator of FtsH protease